MEAQKALLQRDLATSETYGSSEDEEEDASGSDESEGEEEAQWGRNKKTYYQRGDEAADAAEEGDAEAGRRGEEEEAGKANSEQAGGEAERGRLCYDSEDSVEDEDGGGAAAGGSKPTGLSREEQLAAIERDAPSSLTCSRSSRPRSEVGRCPTRSGLHSRGPGAKGKKGGGKGNEIAECCAQRRRGRASASSSPSTP